MRARQWTIAGAYRSPADYDIPELPAWRACRTADGGLALADADGTPFIAAEDPVRVRR